MTTQDKVKVIAEYDGWVNTGLLHPFKPENGYQYRKEGLIGVSWLPKMQYLTSLDWLHPVAMKVLKSLECEDKCDLPSEFWNIVNCCHLQPINGEYIDLFNAVYDGIVFLNSNK